MFFSISQELEYCSLLCPGPYPPDPSHERLIESCVATIVSGCTPEPKRRSFSLLPRSPALIQTHLPLQSARLAG